MKEIGKKTTTTNGIILAETVIYIYTTNDWHKTTWSEYRPTNRNNHVGRKEEEGEKTDPDPSGEQLIVYKNLCNDLIKTCGQIKLF